MLKLRSGVHVLPPHPVTLRRTHFYRSLVTVSSPFASTRTRSFAGAFDAFSRRPGIFFDRVRHQTRSGYWSGRIRTQLNHSLDGLR
jgi:hypothetical protein